MNIHKGIYRRNILIINSGYALPINRILLDTLQCDYHPYTIIIHAFAIIVSVTLLLNRPYI